ncbi:MAG: hypothetical protein GTO02_02410 [Candidatus Dadabacteria bacterium]|nr:hypothetical protein [Candidatus Dadabacteria bacterium]
MKVDINVIKKGDKIALIVVNDKGYYDIDSGLTYGETIKLEKHFKLKCVKNLKQFAEDKFGLAI